MRKTVPCQILFGALWCCASAGALEGQQSNGQGWQQPYEAKILSEFKLTQLTPNGLSVALPGTVVVLQKDNLALYSLAVKRFYTPEDEYVDGSIDPEMSQGFLDNAQNRGEVHMMNAGDRLWLTGIKFEKKGNGASLQFITDPIHGVPYAGALKFKFAKNTQPTPDQFLQTISEVVQPEGAAPAVSVDAAKGTAVQSPSAVAGGPAPASSPGPIDPTNLTVAGVKLGMTPDEAIEALKNFEAFPVVQKRYIFNADDSFTMSGGGTRFGYGGLGVSEDCNGAKSQPNRLLVAILAARAYRISSYRFVNGKKVTNKVSGACDWTGATDDTVDQDPLEVAIYFSPTPGKERVIAVSLSGSFRNKPLAQTVLDRAVQKYSTEVTSKSGQDVTYEISWRFDGRNRLMSESTAMRSGLEQSRLGGSGFSLPPSVSSTNGIGLDFGVLRESQNKEIANGYWVRLFRESDLAQFTSQAKTFFRTLAEKQKQEQIDKAKQAGAGTKF